MKGKLLLNHKLRAALLMLFLCALYPLHSYGANPTTTYNSQVYSINLQENYATVTGPKEGWDRYSVEFTNSITYGNNEYPVTVIGVAAYRKRTKLRSLNLPEGLQIIEENAFSHCTGLTGTLKFPESLTTIGNECFYNCNNLTGLTFGKSLTMMLFIIVQN